MAGSKAPAGPRSAGGTDHYEGTYNFKGTMEGQVQEISTSYSGDFVKADCGNVKPFGPPPGR